MDQFRNSTLNEVFWREVWPPEVYEAPSHINTAPPYTCSEDVVESEWAAALGEEQIETGTVLTTWHLGHDDF